MPVLDTKILDDQDCLNLFPAPLLHRHRLKLVEMVSLPSLLINELHHKPRNKYRNKSA